LTCEASAALYCEREFACNAEDAKEFYGSPELCVMIDVAYCHGDATLAGVSPSATQSWIACNRALAARTCDQWKFGGNVAECATPPGTRQPGETCNVAGQCASTFCKVTEDPMTGRVSDCGVCAPAPGLGEACDEENGCARGLWCRETSNPGSFVCIRPGMEGETCADDAPEGTCRGQLVCVGGLCARPLAAGGACTSMRQCQQDLRCTNGTCNAGLSEGATCKPEDLDCAEGLGCAQELCVQRRRGGSVCQVDEECLSDSCRESAGNSRRTCAGTNPTAEAGEPCTPDAPYGTDTDNNRCRYSAFCDATTRRCVLDKTQGQACTDGEQCLLGLECLAGKCDRVPDMCM
jgi:hypothetical protein